MTWTLKRLSGFTPRPGPVLVVVMDGVGLGPGDAGDAVALARTPVLDWLRENCPGLVLKAHGTAVGLPSDADMGNSEVGHNALGAGRVFDQGAKLVNRAILNGSIFEGATWKKLVACCHDRDHALHFIGLLSDGGVHSLQDHLHAMVTRAFQDGVRRVFVHVLLDGRDVPETSALIYVDRLEKLLAQYHGRDGRIYRIASGGGRMTTTMDRYEADWRIVERGWNAHVHGEARASASAREAIETFRREKSGVGDQFLSAFVVAENGQPLGPIRDGDSVIFFNYRGDRAIEISDAFEQEEFLHFNRRRVPDVEYAGMMEYDGDKHVPRQYLVTPPLIERTMGEFLARNGVSQYACSETQKFGHVTYFWNGNRTGVFDEGLEEYHEISSDRVAFQQRPWMKAAEITDATIRRLRRRSFSFGRINYPNGDMVGHTGDRRASILAVETVDLCLGRLLATVRGVQGIAIITADHGNSDEMYERDADGEFSIDPATNRPRPRTSHSLNPVPLILYDPLGLEESGRRLTRTPPGIGRNLAAVRSEASYDLTADAATFPLDLAAPNGGAGLANAAATCLNLLGFEAPEDYAPSLLVVRRGAAIRTI
jgi:2,3-bisphosphoglycerate-independent phosphoglycerate mutase